MFDVASEIERLDAEVVGLTRGFLEDPGCYLRHLLD
jgi:hypothetical protein